MSATCSDELMTAGELAARLGVKPGTVLGWHRLGKIPSLRLSHKVLRFNLSNVLAAMGGHKTASEKGAVHAS